MIPSLQRGDPGLRVQELVHPRFVSCRGWTGTQVSLTPKTLLAKAQILFDTKHPGTQFPHL